MDITRPEGLQEWELAQQHVTHFIPCCTTTALLEGKRGRKLGKALHVVFRGKLVIVTNLILKTGL